MRTLGIDIETFGSVDLKTCGLYKYVESPDFEILLFGYSIDGKPTEVVDLASGEKIPSDVMDMLKSIFVKKTAWNAAFERTCISKYFGIPQGPSKWECTMAKAAQLGLPLSLDACSKAMNLEEGKMAAGSALIRYFCVPCKGTKTNGFRTRNLPEHNPDKWNVFKQYCAQDVISEQTIGKRLSFFKFPDSEKELWNLDQRINDRGMMLDPVLIKNAISFDLKVAEKLTQEAAGLTGLDNPNSVKQLKDWMMEETGEEIKSLSKKTIPKILRNANSEIVKKVLKLRQKMAKTSIKKYLAMHRCIMNDKRARGVHQYYGADTGRFAGRLYQPHNLTKNKMKELDEARRIVRLGDLELMELCFDDIPDTLSQLIRTAIVAPKGSRFIPSDLKAIEARVLAWLADEKWRLDVFKTHGLIYEASGSHMFKVPIEQVTKGSDLREKAKIGELALGYQGGWRAIITMGGLEMGVVDDALFEAEIAWPKIKAGTGAALFKTFEDYEQHIIEKELKSLVNAWREANPNIVKYWKTVGNAAIEAVETGRKVTISQGVYCQVRKDVLYIGLPSGRELAYQSPKLRQGEYGPELTFMAVDKIWRRVHTYGGKLVENIVQAIARDVLADCMIRVDDADYKIVLHVHDEIVPEMPYGEGSVEEIERIMSEPIAWAKGLPLGADAYETEYYRKD